MMQFHLDFTPPRLPLGLTYDTRFFLIGSCFGEHIGELLRKHRFSVFSNPFGTIYNPVSLLQCFHWASSGPPAPLPVTSGGRTFSYHCHSTVTGDTPSALETSFAQAITQSSRALSEADVIVITFGSAYAYRHRELDMIVANCHRQPQATFTKELLSVATIVKETGDAIIALRTRNASARLLFTVSPVKHLRDGVVENSISKATLLLAVRELTATHPDCYYFPSYELVADDLRDYRFYGKDLAHPNELAIAYVWEKFCASVFDDNTLRTISHVKKLNDALAHRSGDSADPSLAEFIANQKEIITSLSPSVTF